MKRPFFHSVPTFLLMIIGLTPQGGGDYQIDDKLIGAAGGDIPVPDPSGGTTVSMFDSDTGHRRRFDIGVSVGDTAMALARSIAAVPWRLAGGATHNVVMRV